MTEDRLRRALAALLLAVVIIEAARLLVRQREALPVNWVEVGQCARAGFYSQSECVEIVRRIDE